MDKVTKTDDTWAWLREDDPPDSFVYAEKQLRRLRTALNRGEDMLASEEKSRIPVEELAEKPPDIVALFRWDLSGTSESGIHTCFDLVKLEHMFGNLLPIGVMKKKLFETYHFRPISLLTKHGRSDEDIGMRMTEPTIPESATRVIEWDAVCSSTLIWRGAQPLLFKYESEETKGGPTLSSLRHKRDTRRMITEQPQLLTLRDLIEMYPHLPSSLITAAEFATASRLLMSLSTVNCLMAMLFGISSVMCNSRAILTGILSDFELDRIPFPYGDETPITGIVGMSRVFSYPSTSSCITMRSYEFRVPLLHYYKYQPFLFIREERAMAKRRRRAKRKRAKMRKGSGTMASSRRTGSDMSYETGTDTELDSELESPVTRTNGVIHSPGSRKKSSSLAPSEPTIEEEMSDMDIFGLELGSTSVMSSTTAVTATMKDQTFLNNRKKLSKTAIRLIVDYIFDDITAMFERENESLMAVADYFEMDEIGKQTLAVLDPYVWQINSLYILSLLASNFTALLKISLERRGSSETDDDVQPNLTDVKWTTQQVKQQLWRWARAFAEYQRYDHMHVLLKCAPVRVPFSNGREKENVFHFLFSSFGEVCEAPFRVRDHGTTFPERWEKHSEDELVALLGIMQEYMVKHRKLDSMKQLLSEPKVSEIVRLNPSMFGKVRRVFYEESH